MSKIVALALLAILSTDASVAAQPTSAEALFARYQALEQAFDPAVADLYCDSALIRNVRTYPSGEKRALELPAPTYKDLVRSAMPLTKARKDISTYSDVRYVQEGSNTRITASRFSELKNYTSPISILVGQCGNTGLAILEELSESRP